jgi:hypothetical protein
MTENPFEIPQQMRDLAEQNRLYGFSCGMLILSEITNGS